MKITNKQLEKELMNSGGVIGFICLKYNIRRQSLWERIKKNPRLTEAFIEARESIKDDVESAFIKAIKEGKKWAVEKGIGMLCQDRGYESERSFFSIKIESQSRQKQMQEKMENMSNSDLNELRSLQEKMIQIYNQYPD